MIDMHIHAVHPQLPGVKPLTDLYDGPKEALVAELREQMRRSGTTTLLGMGHLNGGCLLYTSDAADERSRVDLGGRRCIKKKKTHNTVCRDIQDTKSKRQYAMIVQLISTKRRTPRSRKTTSKDDLE